MSHPMIHYKPGLTMDEPISITMAAADWAVLMAWFSAQSTDGFNHIIYGIIAAQIEEQLYDQASVKAAKAHHAEHRVQQVTSLQDLLSRTNPFGIVQIPDPEDFGYGQEGTDEE